MYLFVSFRSSRRPPDSYLRRLKILTVQRSSLTTPSIAWFYCTWRHFTHTVDVDWLRLPWIFVRRHSSRTTSPSKMTLSHPNPSRSRHRYRKFQIFLLRCNCASVLLLFFWRNHWIDACRSDEDIKIHSSDSFSSTSLFCFEWTRSFCHLTIKKFLAPTRLFSSSMSFLFYQCLDFCILSRYRFGTRRFRSRRIIKIRKMTKRYPYFGQEVRDIL